MVRLADLDWGNVRQVMAGDCVVDDRAVLNVDHATAAGLRVVGLPRYQAAASSDRPRPLETTRDRRRPPEREQ